MGTSTRWGGPRGGPWDGAFVAVRRLPCTSTPGEKRLTEAAEQSVRGLRETLRRDESAFGLLESTQAAGGRLVSALECMRRGGAYEVVGDGEEFLAWLADEVGGTGATTTDAAIRRAAVSSGVRLLERQSDAPDGRLSSDLLCELYQWFFADVVAEFLRAVVTTHIKLVFPLTEFVDPEGRLVERVANSVVELVGNPCEEMDRRRALAEESAAAVDEPEAALTDVALELVPKSVRRVLGLALAEDESEELP